MQASATGHVLLRVRTDGLANRLRLRRLWALLLVLLVGSAFVRPSLAADHSAAEGSGRAVVRSGQEAAVEALLSPWREGYRLDNGARWTGTQIAHERICFAFESPRADGGVSTGGVCLAVANRAQAVLDPQTTLAVTSEVVAGWDGPPLGSATERAVIEAVAAQIRSTTTAPALRALWTAPAIDPTQLRVSPVESGSSSTAQRAATLVMLLAALGWLLRSGFQEARPLPGGGAVWSVGLLALSAGVRWGLSPPAPMDAWSWTRITAGGELVAQLPFLVHVFAPDGTWFGTAESVSMLVLASLTPLALFCHAARLFGDPRVAMAAGLLLALSPHHIRFSAAPTQFIPSLLTSSLCFYWLYQTIDATKPVERAVRLGLLPVWLWLSFSMRPLNVFFAPLMVGAIAIASRSDARRWRSGVTVLVGTTVVVRLLIDNDEYTKGAPQHPLHMLVGAAQLLLRPGWNPLTFWRLTPPVWLPLILAGFVVLWRAPWSSLAPKIARARAVWLAAWLFGFIALHGVVVVDEPMNNARYQLHSLPAMAMLAGAGLMGLWWHERGRRWALAAMLPAVAAPWLHAASIGDVAFDVMQERAFLEQLRDDPQSAIPQGCQVVELMRSRGGEQTSRLDRVMMRVAAPTEAPPHWKRVILQPPPTQVVDVAHRRTVGAVPEQPDERGIVQGAPLVLLPDATDRLASLQGCVAFYEGPECAQGPGERQRHPACQAVLEAADWQLAAERSFVARIYDHSVSQHLHHNGETVSLRVWRRRAP